MTQAERVALRRSEAEVARVGWGVGELSESTHWAYYLLLPSLLLVAMVAVYPVASGVWLSFQRYNLLGAPSPSFVGLAQYADLWTDSVFWTAVRNTVVWVTVGAGSQFLLGLTVALALNRPRLRGIGLLRLGLLLTWLMPTVVAGHMWSLLLDSRLGVVNDVLVRLGLLHSYAAWFAQAETALGAVLVVDLWKNFPFFTLLLPGAGRGRSASRPDRHRHLLAHLHQPERDGRPGQGHQILQAKVSQRHRQQRERAELRFHGQVHTRRPGWGGIYGVPSFAFVNWMYYRADWFKEAGLAPPKTFDDF